MWYGELWFWLLLIGIILLIVSVVVYEMKRDGDVSAWFWGAFLLAVTLILTGSVVYLCKGVRVVKVVYPTLSPLPPVVVSPISQVGGLSSLSPN